MSVLANVDLRQISNLDQSDKWNCPYWYALYTKSRHEKLVSRELTKKRFENFLPLRKIKRHWSDRMKTVEEPLFTGYLFVRMPLRERWSVLNTAGVAKFVGPHPSDPLIVSESSISSVRRFIENDIAIDPFPYLKKGQKIYIRSGPLKGTEGFIVHKDKQGRLVVSLDLLMQSVSVVIDEQCVEIC